MARGYSAYELQRSQNALKMDPGHPTALPHIGPMMDLLQQHAGDQQQLTDSVYDWLAAAMQEQDSQALSNLLRQPDMAMQLMTMHVRTSSLPGPSLAVLAVTNLSSTPAGCIVLCPFVMDLSEGLLYTITLPMLAAVFNSMAGFTPALAYLRPVLPALLMAANSHASSRTYAVVSWDLLNVVTKIVAGNNDAARETAEHCMWHVAALLQNCDISGLQQWARSV